MQLDDLGSRHVPRRLRGELHHQHGADGEVRRDEHVRPAEAVELRRGRSRSSRSRRERPPRRACPRVVQARWSGIVKSTSTSGVGRARRSRSTPERRVGARRPAPCRRRPSTAPHTVSPIRPAAPATATLITPRLRSDRLDRRDSASSNCALVRADPGRREPLGRPQLVDQRRQVVERHRVDPRRPPRRATAAARRPAPPSPAGSSARRSTRAPARRGPSGSPWRGSSSSAVAGSSRSRVSSVATTVIASARFSARVPRYRPTWPVS